MRKSNTVTTTLDSHLHLLPMQPIFQVHFKIVHPHLWPRRVQFSRAVLTFDSWVVHEFDIVGSGRVGAHGDGEVGEGADCCVAHCTFEGVGRIILLQAVESVKKPLRGLRLDPKVSSGQCNEAWGVVR